MYPVSYHTQIIHQGEITSTIHISQIVPGSDAAAMSTMVTGNTCYTILSHEFHKRKESFLTPANAMRKLQDRFRRCIRSYHQDTDFQTIRTGCQFHYLLHKYASQDKFN